MYCWPSLRLDFSVWINITAPCSGLRTSMYSSGSMFSLSSISPTDRRSDQFNTGRIVPTSCTNSVPPKHKTLYNLSVWPLLLFVYLDKYYFFLVIQCTWINDGRFFKQLFTDENVFCKGWITHYNKICISIKYVYCIYIMKMFIKISKMKSIHYIVYQRVVFAQDFAVLYTECVTLWSFWVSVDNGEYLKLFSPVIKWLNMNKSSLL